MEVIEKLSWFRGSCLGEFVCYFLANHFAVTGCPVYHNPDGGVGGADVVHVFSEDHRSDLGGVGGAQKDGLEGSGRVGENSNQRYVWSVYDKLFYTNGCMGECVHFGVVRRGVAGEGDGGFEDLFVHVEAGYAITCFAGR